MAQHRGRTEASDTDFATGRYPEVVEAFLQACPEPLRDAVLGRFAALGIGPDDDLPAAREAVVSGVSEHEAASVTRPWDVLLAQVGNRLELTPKGHLPPAVVTEVFDELGMEREFDGPATREENTPPVAQLRSSAVDLELLVVRHNRLEPTAAAIELGTAPLELWHHLAAHLPAGAVARDQHAGVLALLAVAEGGQAGLTFETTAAKALGAIGWRVAGGPATAKAAFAWADPTWAVLVRAGAVAAHPVGGYVAPARGKRLALAALAG